MGDWGRSIGEASRWYFRGCRSNGWIVLFYSFEWKAEAAGFVEVLERVFSREDV